MRPDQRHAVPVIKKGALPGAVEPPVTRPASRAAVIPRT